MEIETGRYYVRNSWNKEYSFMKVGQDERGYYYELNNSLRQYLERGAIDDLERYEIVETLSSKFEPEFTNASISVTATNQFGHQMEYGARDLLRFREILNSTPSLAKALGINLKKKA
ncbi:hypothetical protein BFP97_06340 [Roseivirga sp. 4D4]|uniref:hypothetical protein n=1 Tax=Roseivirga sp. 4D4 TaxID=1889784 RepID=UPI0008530790|nr:hypothetical protein [Roseivirga sp. 4D4]OEK01150.1 hypothetical protein BFP97_06340 [Roseivirga sp. 4D4]